MMTTSSDFAARSSETIGRGEAPSRAVSMTERYLGFDWAAELPWTIEGLTIEHGSADEVLSFLGARGNDLFSPPNNHFLNEPATPAKRRFCAEMDALIIRREKAIVGYFLGHPTDWSTYYVRSVAILPELRNSRIASLLSARIYSVLAERTEIRRIECDTSIANPAVPRILTGLGFIPTMTVTSERWGLMTRYTRFVDAEARKAFSRQFVNAPDLGQEIQGERT